MATGNGQQAIEDRSPSGSVLVASESLSNCHICTQGRDDGSSSSSSWRDDREAGGYNATFYPGGSLVEVRERKQDAKDLQRASAMRGALRETSKHRYVKDDDQDQAGSRRGKVTVFSSKARRRMHLLLGKVDAAEGCLFLTLTVSDAVAHDGRSMKLYLRRFKARLTRRFPNAAMLWRLECVPRKSGVFVGQAVGHYHALLWGVPDQVGLKQWIGDAWSGSVGDQSRTRVEVPRSSKAVQGYCAKLYLTKAGDDDMIEDVGRFWGVLQDDRIPWASVLVRRLSNPEAVKLLRVFRKWIKAGRRSRGKRGKVPYLLQWRSFFVDDPAYWAYRVDTLVAEAGPDVPVMIKVMVGRLIAVLLSGIGRTVEVRTL